jgi:beta-lactamase superfamily II metal-dependent hydrolase
MKVTVHDVGHGLCISLIHQNGNVMLWDCGHEAEKRPSVFLPQIGVREIHRFFITNYDEDHISDLPDLRRKIPIRLLYRNKTISAEELKSLKKSKGPITKAMESLFDMINTYTGSQPDTPPEFPFVYFSVYFNKYGSEFTDTNNISLVTFLYCNGHCFLIPGDLECSGWEKLLEKSEFRKELENVDTYIASHHGREDGYCSDVFQYCKPSVVVFSDGCIDYETQKMASTYAQHASGIYFKNRKRYVLTTRDDGTFYWDFGLEES